MSSADNFAASLLESTGHRPWPLPAGKFALAMRWTNLLFAHWPVPAYKLSPLLPSRYEIDVYDGAAWVGIVPFRMESVQLRGLPALPGAAVFPEVNVRTYVRERKSGEHGVFFFSLDTSSPLAVLGARSWYHLPYFLASMRMEPGEGNTWQYRSRRLFTTRPARLRACYQGAPQHVLPPSMPGTIEHFLTERYALFTHTKRRLLRADIHHRQWTLEPAEAAFEDLTLAAVQGIALPDEEPLLHYSRKLEVLAWPPRVIS